MERLQLLAMTAVLTVLIWVAADSLVTEVGSVGVTLRLVPPGTMLVQMNSPVERFELQVSGPRRTVEAVQAHGTYNVRWPIEERPNGEASIPLDRFLLKDVMADQWKEFGKLSIVAVEPAAVPVIVDHLVMLDGDLVMNRLTSQFDVEPQLQRSNVTVRVRESSLGGQASDQRIPIDVSADLERLLKEQPVGKSVTLRLPLDARRFGSDAEITPATVEFTASVRAQRVVERIPTVPVLVAMSFTSLDAPLQALARDGTPLTLVTQTIAVAGAPEDVARLSRGETRAYGVIQIKEDDLAQLGVLKLTTPEYHLPKGVELAEPPPSVEFQLISRKFNEQKP